MIKFAYGFATDTPGGPNISMMVATDSIHGRLCDAEFPKLHRSVGYGDRAELKCDQEPSTLDVANALIKRCQSTALIVTATPRGSKGSLVHRERANLTIQGQLRAFREAVSMRYKTEVGPDHVLMGWMVQHCAWGCKKLSSEGNRETALSFYPGQGLHWRSGAIWRSVVGAKPFRGWSQIGHEVDARSFCWQA